MKRSRFTVQQIFTFSNYAFFILMAFLCLLPFINLVSLSFSSSSAVTAGEVKLWPIGFNLKSYEFILKSGKFVTAFLVSIKRVVVGTIVNMFLTILVAYPLSREKKDLRTRTLYAWFFILTTLFNAGLIPWYMTIKFTGLLDNFFALIIPSALPVFNVIVLLNFFRGLPKELEESAFLDGASQWTTLWKIFIPLSKPALATLTLFCSVYHWNSWFDGLVLMNNPEHYPLQSYLQSVIINPETFFSSSAGKGGDYQNLIAFVSARTAKSAQIFIAAFPMLLVYPFLQKYFTKGLVLGSVKG